ncbi:MAG TPA: MFS transporter, partial [Phycisphaerae bacterium]|nr:MFS transporter [Phycisphaerae bacterium]
MMKQIRKIMEFLGLRRSIMGLLSMVILVGMGEHMAEQFLPVYLLALGGGVISIGFLNGMDNLLGALYAFPGGYLSERLGYKRALLIFNVMSMAGFVIVILIPKWWAVIVGAALFLSWTAISLPATMSLVARVLPKDKRTMGVSVHSLVRRIPMAVGPMIGGWFIVKWGTVDGVRLAFIGALAMAVVALIAQQVLIEDEKPKDRKAAPSVRSMLSLLPRMNPNLRSLLVSDILIRFCEQIPYAFVVVWSMSEVAGYHTAQISAEKFGVLRAVEMATAILIYIPVAYMADRTHKKPFVVMTFIFFTLFPLMLLFSRSFEMLLAAFVLRGLKEFGEPTRKALIMDLAPEDQKAGMFGVYYLVRDVIVSIAAFGGA